MRKMLTRILPVIWIVILIGAVSVSASIEGNIGLMEWLDPETLALTEVGQSAAITMPPNSWQSELTISNKLDGHTLYISAHDNVILMVNFETVQPVDGWYCLDVATLPDHQIAIVNGNTETVVMTAKVPAPAPTLFNIEVARMILGNSLEFQFGVEKSKFTTTQGYYAIIEKTWADGSTTETKVPATKWIDATDYWAIPYDSLAAKEMADDFYVTIYNAQGVAVSNRRTDSVRDYVMRNINKQNTVGKTLMVDMLNYGAFAQKNFDYGTEDLANNLLTAAHKAYATAQMKSVSNNRVQGANYQGTRLVLESRIQLQLAFKNLTADKYAIYTFTNNSGVKQNIRVDGTEFIDAGSAYVVEASELVCADARALVTFTVYNADGTVYATASDSIESYVARNLDIEAAVMLMKFTDSAKSYLYG